MTRESAEAQARLCAHLLAVVMDWPRGEFGEDHGLAVSAAYDRVQRLLVSELERCACGGER